MKTPKPKRFNHLRIMPQYLLPQRYFSGLMGKLAQIKNPVWVKNMLIKKFIRRYQVDLSEAEEPDYKKYECFNDFFVRKLLVQARPINVHETTIVSPADGTISEIGVIHENKLIQAKNHYYSLTDLLNGNKIWAESFEKGLFMTIYLSPKDYHRVHMPLSGKFIEKIYVPGKLFSVNPLTVEIVPNLFARNERVISIFETAYGKMAVIFVGAIIVGSIVVTGIENTVIKKGKELGYFRLGSTVILLFENNVIDFLDHLKPGVCLKTGSVIAQEKLHA